MTNRILTTTVLLALFFLPASAFGYSRLSTGDCSDGWRQPSDQRLYMNWSNMSNLGAILQMMAAVSDLADRINAVGGIWFDFETPYELESESYSFDGSLVNDNGKNEIGLANLSALPTGTRGFAPTEVDSETCEAVESDIYLDMNRAWDWGVPSDGRPEDDCGSAECYFDAQDKYCSDGTPWVSTAACSTGTSVTWGRPVLLHEIGHTLDLAHSDHSYSFMNYNIRPWTNRTDSKRIEFLPDDREALRDIYPGSANEVDAAVTMTWFDSGNTSNGAASADRLCRSSTGTRYSSNIFSETCGVDDAGGDGSTEVCPGDTIYVRYAIANYGTEPLTVDEQLWFSKNTHLNRTAGADIKAPNNKADKYLAAQSSYRRGKAYTVPAGLTYGKEYYPILFIDSGADFEAEESTQNNWIPTRSKLEVKSLLDCMVRLEPSIP